MENGQGGVACPAVVGEPGKSSGKRRAAQLCQAYENNGYKDWFLPSKDELNWMYVNLKKKGLGGFADNYYWSSSRYTKKYDAWAQRFSDGRQYLTNETIAGCVRAVRAF